MVKGQLFRVWTPKQCCNRWTYRDIVRRFFAGVVVVALVMLVVDIDVALESVRDLSPVSKPELVGRKESVW